MCILLEFQHVLNSKSACARRFDTITASLKKCMNHLEIQGAGRHTNLQYMKINCGTRKVAERQCRASQCERRASPS